MMHGLATLKVGFLATGDTLFDTDVGSFHQTSPPEGHDPYVTTPGSGLLFSSLRAPTGELAPSTPTRSERCADRAVMMPKRRLTRAQQSANQSTRMSPVPPSTSTSAPGGRRRVAPCASTTQGTPNSRATTAACDIGPPSSVTTAAA